jgi:hypothetical protein
MKSDKKLDEKLKELGIAKAIENKDVPYVIAQIEGIVKDTETEQENITAKRIFDELDNLHVVENWSIKNGEKIPLLLKQIGAYNDIKRKYEVD